MRVICLKPLIVEGAKCKGKPRPQVGDEDIVMDERVVYGVLYYVLQRFGKHTGYNAKNFAILPDAEPEAITEEETLLTTV